MNQSLTITGIAVFVLAQVFTPEEANQLVDAGFALLNAVGILMAYFGRYRQGDITWYGRKV